jgi:hypothetical protein
MTCQFCEGEQRVVSYQTSRQSYSTSGRGNPTNKIDERERDDWINILSLKIQTISTVLSSPSEAVKVNNKSYPTISLCELERNAGLKFPRTHRT